MPILAPIVGAVAGYGMLTVAGASVGTMIAGGAMLAGSALSIIGQVTGSQKLQKFGGILSLAGGVGALATGGWQALGSQIAGESAIADVAGGGSGISSIGAEQMGAQAIEGAAAMDPLQAANMGAGTPASAPSGMLSKAMGSAQPAADMVTGNAASATGAPTVPGGTSRLSTLGKWVKDNKELVNVGGGLLSGAMGRNDKQDLLQQQRDYQLQDRSSLNASVQGAAGAMPVVDPNAQPFNTQPQDPSRFRTPVIPQRKYGG